MGLLYQLEQEMALKETQRLGARSPFGVRARLQDLREVFITFLAILYLIVQDSAWRMHSTAFNRHINGTGQDRRASVGNVMQLHCLSRPQYLFALSQCCHIIT